MKARDTSRSSDDVSGHNARPVAGSSARGTADAASGPAAGSVVRERMQILVSAALRSGAGVIDRFTMRLGGALTAASLSPPDSASAALLQQAAEHLSRDRRSFQRLFFDCLQHSFEHEIQVLEAQPKKRLRTEALDLSLTSFEAMQRQVVIDNQSQAFDRANAERLGILQMRVAHWLEKDEAGMRNPFRAAVFLRAALDAWDRFEPHQATRDVLLCQLSPDHFMALDTVLQAIDQELVVRDVLPQAEELYRKRNQDNGLAAIPLLQAERRALRRAGAVFDHAFASLLRPGALPPHVGNHLATLAPALRRLALDEPRFLRHARHPGRRLLQAVIHASLACAPEARPGAALNALIGRVAGQLEQDASPAQLEAACGEVEALFARTMQATLARREECIAEAARQEMAECAERIAQRLVNARLESGGVPAFVDRFLTQHWTRVLAFVHRVHANKPELLPNLVQAMDDLIWSVQPKESAAERDIVGERVPALLVLLNAWLTVLKWSGTERESFFSELAARHAVILSAPAHEDARALLEERMDDAERAADHELARRAAEQEDDALAHFMHLIANQVPGDWAEFVRNDGSIVNCRLAWIGPARMRFVFVAPQAALVFAIAEKALAQGLRAARVRFIATGEVFGTALAAALREFGVPAVTEP